MTTNSITINIAGVVTGIDFPNCDWSASSRERYAAFLTDERPEWRVTVLTNASAPFEDPGWAVHEGPVTHFHVHWYIGEIDLASRTASVTAPATERVSSALERTLAYITMQALPREHQSILLHASGIVIDGQGLVFFGPSGAGKTTVARLAAGRGDLLSDENVVVRLGDEGVLLCSTPFWGHSTPPEMICRVNRCVPVAGLFALKQAPEFALKPLAPGQAVAALLTTEKVATERVESASAWLNVVGLIVDRCPVYILAFRPTLELWPFLARHNGEKLV